jgi:hypothetical protein
LAWQSYGYAATENSLATAALTTTVIKRLATAMIAAPSAGALSSERDARISTNTVKATDIKNTRILAIRVRISGLGAAIGFDTDVLLDEDLSRRPTS